MAQILAFDSTMVLAKQEVTYGVDPTLTGAINAMLALNGTVRLEADQTAREISKPHFGADPSFFTNKRVIAEFEIEMQGSGVVDTPPAYAPLLLSAAMAETITVATDVDYTPVSSNIPSVAVAFWINRHKYLILGAQVSLRWEIAIDSFAKARLTVTGLFAIPVDAAQEVPNFSAFREPALIDKSVWNVTLDGFVVDCTNLTLDIANDVRRYAGSDNECIATTGRNPSGEITIYDPTLPVKDFFAIANARTKVPLVSTVGTVAGDIIELSAPLCHLGLPRETDIDGSHGLVIPYTPLPSDSGNDEFTYTTK